MLHGLRVRYSLSLGPALLSGSRGVHPLFGIYFFLCVSLSSSALGALTSYLVFPVRVASVAHRKDQTRMGKWALLPM